VHRIEEKLEIPATHIDHGGSRRLTVLALARLALECPTCNNTLGRIADDYGGYPMFEEMKQSEAARSKSINGETLRRFYPTGETLRCPY
jgi:hypothetical protein